MPQTKTRLEREKELQALMRTPEGRAKLEEFASRYQGNDGMARPECTSVITYIIVHERGKGLIAD